MLICQELRQQMCTVSGEVTGDLNGASKLKYRGNPSLKVDRSAGASFESTQLIKE